MVGNAKFASVSRKKDAKISSFLRGRTPLIFRLRGTRPPHPPTFDARTDDDDDDEDDHDVNEN